MSKIDVLIVGSGMYGATVAQQLHEQGKKVLVIDKRNHIAGNCYTDLQHNIPVHVYGGHVAHTNSSKVWKYWERFSQFNNFKCSVKVNYLGKLYSFPINLFSLNQVYGCTTPQEAELALQKARVAIDAPSNLEEWCLSQIGPELYEIFIKGYTERQWGRSATELPMSIIKRIPIRLDMNDTYFLNAKHEGIPIGGYTPMFEKMLDGIEVKLNTDYLTDSKFFDRLADKVIYSGPIDEFFNYRLGPLEYRSLRFQFETLDGIYQGNHTINYTHCSSLMNRTHEHKYFDMQSNPKTVISHEFPEEWSVGKERYYPIGNEKNNILYSQYKDMIDTGKYLFGGRLGRYKYYDMDQVCAEALHDVEKYF